MIYYAGGCFWGTQHYFSKVAGVKATRTGFANGATADPSYEEVYTDTTGHAETVMVEYDPAAVSLEFLTEMYFLAVDPLSLNRQGHDEGTRYRTGIYYSSEEDLPILKKVYDSVQSRFSSPIAVELQPLKCFYPASEYHQDYLLKNPDGYCHLSPSLFTLATNPAKVHTYIDLLRDFTALCGEDGSFEHAGHSANSIDSRDTFTADHSADSFDRRDTFTAGHSADSAGEDGLSLMANLCALIHERMGFFWTGFYIVRGDQLRLGPFQGPVACMRISRGRGVCGTAWDRGETIIVPDVDQFPGHIACSSLSRSEIVIPLRSPRPSSTSSITSCGEEIWGVLDIDSERLGTFDEIDAAYLERLAALLPPWRIND